MIPFNDKELEYLQDTDFLITKHQIIEKLTQLLEGTRQSLKTTLDKLNFAFPEGVDIQQGKISKGEQYQQLPYLVLDYPKKLTREDVFAFRTMVWWGHEFSCTLMLAGESWGNYRNTLHSKLLTTSIREGYIGVNTNPWEYHFGADNYQSISTLTESDLQQLLSKISFFKLSQKLPLNESENLPDFASNTFEHFIKLLQ